MFGQQPLSQFKGPSQYSVYNIEVNLCTICIESRGTMGCCKIKEGENVRATGTNFDLYSNLWTTNREKSEMANLA